MLHGGGSKGVGTHLVISVIKKPGTQYMHIMYADREPRGPLCLQGSAICTWPVDHNGMVCLLLEGHACLICTALVRRITVPACDYQCVHNLVVNGYSLLGQMHVTVAHLPYCCLTHIQPL